MIPMVDLKRQYHSLKSEIDSAIQDVLEQAQFILGPNVSKLEEEVAAYHSLPYAVGVANGTDALLLALRACGIGPGDEVITTPFTFIATAEVIALLNAVPVFADINPNTFNIDCNQIADKITNKTKATDPMLGGLLISSGEGRMVVVLIAQNHEPSVVLTNHASMLARSCVAASSQCAAAVALPLSRSNTAAARSAVATSAFCTTLYTKSGMVQQPPPNSPVPGTKPGAVVMSVRQ